MRALFGSAILTNVNLVDQDAPGASIPSQRPDTLYVEPKLPVGPIPEAEEENSPSPSRWPGIKRGLTNIAFGAAVAGLAVLLRKLIDWPPEVLPFFLVVIAVCLVTVAAGFLGGLTAMIVGGMLTWYYLLNPHGAWTIDGNDHFTLLGYFSVSLVILATSQLYRWSEQRLRQAARGVKKMLRPESH